MYSFLDSNRVAIWGWSYGKKEENYSQFPRYLRTVTIRVFLFTYSLLQVDLQQLMYWQKMTKIFLNVEFL